MNKEYITPEVSTVDMLESASPLCASADLLPSMQESGDMGNLGWS